MRTFFCWSSWIYSFNVLEHYDAVVGWVFPVAPLATTSRLLRDTSQLIRDVMDRSLLAQRTDTAQPFPTSINGTLISPEKSQMPRRGSNTRLVLLKWNTHPAEPTRPMLDHVTTDVFISIYHQGSTRIQSMFISKLFACKPVLDGLMRYLQKIIRQQRRKSIHNIYYINHDNWKSPFF